MSRLAADELMTVITTTNAQRRAAAREDRLRADQRRWPREIQPSPETLGPERAPRLRDSRGTWSAVSR